MSVIKRAIKLISDSHDYELHCFIYDIEPIAVRLGSLKPGNFSIKSVIVMTV